MNGGQLTYECIENAIKAIREQKIVRPLQLVVPSRLFPQCERAMYKKLIKQIGRHRKFRFRNEEWWIVHKLDKKRLFNVRSMFRYEEWDDYGDRPHLPKAMRKRGYAVNNGRIEIVAPPPAQPSLNGGSE